MPARWLSHPRYRLYTDRQSYLLPLHAMLSGHKDGPDRIALLEAEVSRRFGVGAALCVPMARTGLYLALSELIRPGQRVIMSPLTIVDVVNAVLLAGGIPVFADIVRHSCSIDPEQAESLIDNRTGAVIVTHLHGNTAGAHVFQEICRRRGVPLIEDTAQAFGAIEHGQRLGTIGDLGIYSFGFYKNLNSWGGGMLVSNDATLIARIRKRMASLPKLSEGRLLAIGARGLVTDIGTWPPLFAGVIYPFVRYATLRDIGWVQRWLDPEEGAGRLESMPSTYLKCMNEVQAELALRQLNRVDVDTAIRIEHGSLYHATLETLDGLITPRQSDGRSNIYTSYPIQVPERRKLLHYAHARGRDLAAQTLRNCADLAQFSDLHRTCNNARAAAQELVLLPTYPKYPASEIQRNIEVVKEFLQR